MEGRDTPNLQREWERRVLYASHSRKTGFANIAPYLAMTMASDLGLIYANERVRLTRWKSSRVLDRVVHSPHSLLSSASQPRKGDVLGAPFRTEGGLDRDVAAHLWTISIPKSDGTVHSRVHDVQAKPSGSQASGPEVRWVDSCPFWTRRGWVDTT